MNDLTAKYINVISPTASHTLKFLRRVVQRRRSWSVRTALAQARFLPACVFDKNYFLALSSS